MSRDYIRYYVIIYKNLIQNESIWREVVPEWNALQSIKNLRILSVNKIGCICTCLKRSCATTTRKIFLFFFWVGPPGLPIIVFWVGPPGLLMKWPQACQENYFYFFLELWDLLGYNYSWILAGDNLIGLLPGLLKQSTPASTQGP